MPVTAPAVVVAAAAAAVMPPPVAMREVAAVRVVDDAQEKRLVAQARVAVLGEAWAWAWAWAWAVPAPWRGCKARVRLA